MSWNVGFTWDGQEDYVLNKDITFADGLSILHEYVQAEADSADESEVSKYDAVLADISDIKDDPGIMGDPDQWEDADFYGDSITFWIVQN